MVADQMKVAGTATRSSPRRVGRVPAVLACIGLAVLAGGCSWLPTWLGGTPSRSVEPAALTEFKPALGTRVVWRTNVGSGRNLFLRPAVLENAVFAAAADGTVMRLAPDSGQVVWRADAKSRLSAGVGSDGFTVAVGTPRGELIALGADGKEIWRAQVGGELLSPPLVGRGLVISRSSDYRVTAFDAASGKRRWTYQRAGTALTLRGLTELAFAGELVIAGFPGGRLVALSGTNGAVRWDVAVSEPRGATEVERIADVVGAPWVSGAEVCAASYQGRIACFESANGSLRWASELSALTGPGGDDQRVYVVDAKSYVVAFRRAAGANAWRQDKLLNRDLSTPLALRRAVLVGDFEGYVHFLAPEDGAVIARERLDGAIVAAPRASGAGAIVQTQNGAVALLGIE
jgi:outer membrane protein assembly factor BamB